VIKGIVIGFILAIAISVGCVFLYFSTGMAPVATADPPMPFEKKFANMALDAHIEKQHIPPSPVPADEPSLGVFLDPSLRIYGILWSQCGVRGTPERKAFSYNKRTMDRAMGPF
jgi:hypothetical protein